MSTVKITSREYKLCLKADKFKGDEPAALEKAKEFWAALKKKALPAKTAAGNLDTISAAREIRFYDTKDSLLNTTKYIFRERKNLLKEELEVTLKFRHPDRYIAQDRNMQPKSTGKTKVKFEEDIKVPFLSLYSFSGTAAASAEKKITNLKDIISIFPGLAESFSKKNATKPVHLVNNFAVKEIVITGAQLKLSVTPEIYAECALILWYNLEKNMQRPVICEFSFRYADKKEQYTKEAAQAAYDAFMLIQNEMKKWLDPDGNTKTGFVYEG